jgi:hypothetical protein
MKKFVLQDVSVVNMALTVSIGAVLIAEDLTVTT